VFKKIRYCLRVLEKRLVAHRGNLRGADPCSENTNRGLSLALKRGFGIETDVRDQQGDSVISHDMPMKGQECPLFKSIADEFAKISSDQIIAINVKSDGLYKLESFLELDKRERLFFFDMSFPEMLKYQKMGLSVAHRVSEFETQDLESSVAPVDSAWFWVDAFESDWYLEPFWFNKIRRLGNLVIVSPELHGRDPRRVWDWFSSRYQSEETFWLCTDFPEILMSGDW
jgi:hypothetical protein